MPAKDDQELQRPSVRKDTNAKVESTLLVSELKAFE